MKCEDVIHFVGPYLDSELDPTTTFQIQAHLSQCSMCRTRFEREHELECRINQSLQRTIGLDDEVRWNQILHRALPMPRAPGRSARTFWLRTGNLHQHWISLVASLVFLAALASAGLGLRHGGHMPLPNDNRSDWHGNTHESRS